jgi:hypothetical protein
LEKPEGKDQLRDLASRYKDKIEMDVAEIGGRLTG